MSAQWQLLDLLAKRKDYDLQYELHTASKLIQRLPDPLREAAVQDRRRRAAAAGLNPDAPEPVRRGMPRIYRSYDGQQISAAQWKAEMEKVEKKMSPAEVALMRAILDPPAKVDLGGPLSERMAQTEAQQGRLPGAAWFAIRDAIDAREFKWAERVLSAHLRREVAHEANPTEIESLIGEMLLSLVSREAWAEGRTWIAWWRDQIAANDHPESVRMLQVMAKAREWEGKAGNAVAAPAMLAAEREFASRILGPNHATTVGLRNRLEAHSTADHN